MARSVLALGFLKVFRRVLRIKNLSVPALAPHPAMKSEYLGFLLTLRFTLTLGAGDHPYEWGGIFETPESNYMWTAQKVNQNYADPSLTMVAWPVTTFTKEALHTLEETSRGCDEHDLH